MCRKNPRPRRKRPTATLYVDPYSGHEVLAIEQSVEGNEKSLVGVAYDPRSTASPVPWSSDCPHCLAGRQLSLTIHEKREIKLLLSQKQIGFGTRYDVPTNGRTLSLLCWRERKTWRAKAWGKKGTLEASRRPGEKIVYEGDLRTYQSPVLRRCIMFLSSAKTLGRDQILACIRPLVAEQLHRRRARGGRILPCTSIDWIKIAEDLR
jgi:hypothetical protein